MEMSCRYDIDQSPLSPEMDQFVLLARPHHAQPRQGTSDVNGRANDFGCPYYSGQIPLFFRATENPTGPFVIDTIDSKSMDPIYPTLQMILHPPYGIPILHGSFEYSSFWNDEEQEGSLANLVAMGHDLIFQAADGHGGFLYLFTSDGDTLFQFIDCGPGTEPETTDYVSLSDLLCNANYILVDDFSPRLDHQLCTLAWLVAHRFPPFDHIHSGPTTPLARVAEILNAARALAASFPDREDLAGYVSPWTVSFLEAALEGTAFPLAQPCDYLV